MELHEKIISALEKVSRKAKVVPADFIDNAVAEMLALFDNGGLTDKFTDRYRHKFKKDWRTDYPNARSFILIATPLPQSVLKFPCKGVLREAVIPPGYCYYESDAENENIVKETLQGSGYSFKRFFGMPLKLFAVRSGLCAYGRNNITYCEGLGSYIELSGFVSDMEAPKDAAWLPAKRMAQCENCSACVKACPTSCIDENASIIHAERCLTYINENPEDFPEWLSPSAHHAAVGCLVCQRVCPANKGLLKTRVIEDAFDEEDIKAILSGGEMEALPVNTQNKIMAYNLDDCYNPNILSRNLNVLLKA